MAPDVPLTTRPSSSTFANHAVQGYATKSNIIPPGARARRGKFTHAIV